MLHVICYPNLNYKILCVNNEEFAKVMSQTFYRKTNKSEMEQAFRYFDKDDSGIA